MIALSEFVSPSCYVAIFPRNDTVMASKKTVMFDLQAAGLLTGCLALHAAAANIARDSYVAPAPDAMNFANAASAVTTSPPGSDLAGMDLLNRAFHLPPFICGYQSYGPDGACSSTHPPHHDEPKASHLTDSSYAR